MELNLFDNSEVDPVELATATARCYLALGRLDGAIAHAAPNVVALFALMLVRRTLARSLAAAGYLFTDRGGSVCLNSPARLLSGTAAGFMPLREAAG